MKIVWAAPDKPLMRHCCAGSESQTHVVYVYIIRSSVIRHPSSAFTTAAASATDICSGRPNLRGVRKMHEWNYRHQTAGLVSDIAIFVLKRDVKLQLTRLRGWKMREWKYREKHVRKTVCDNVVWPTLQTPTISRHSICAKFAGRVNTCE